MAQVFFVSAGAFAVLSLYAATTKRDLTAIGRFLVLGLVGLVVGSLVNSFLRSSALYWLTTYAGVLIFAGLTAYDNQKLRRLCALQAKRATWPCGGALILHLDFTNLFPVLVRVFGKRRD